MENPWADDAVTVRESARKVVLGLLHDWIKYMEMRALSVDWQKPPRDVRAQLARAIRQTRRRGQEVRGVTELWAAGRQQLQALGSRAAERLVADLDREVEALERLVGTDQSPLPVAEEIERLLRRPGSTLRQARDWLAE